MTPERLLVHYERIADAPDAIAQLRRFILDLAVRGKLVPQDPHDEPAAELLKRVAKGKARLVKAGEIRNLPEPLDVGSADQPFALPFRDGDGEAWRYAHKTDRRDAPLATRRCFRRWRSATGWKRASTLPPLPAAASSTPCSPRRSRPLWNTKWKRRSDGADERERPAALQASCFRICSALERSALPGCGSTLSSLTTPSTTSIE